MAMQGCVGAKEQGFFLFFFFKQKTAYEILTCDWSSDVCSSDLFYFLVCFENSSLKNQIEIMIFVTIRIAQVQQEQIIVRLKH